MPLEKKEIGSHETNGTPVDLDTVDLFEGESRTDKIYRKIKASWARRKNDIIEFKQLLR